MQHLLSRTRSPFRSICSLAQGRHFAAFALSHTVAISQHWLSCTRSPFCSLAHGSLFAAFALLHAVAFLLSRTQSPFTAFALSYTVAIMESPFWKLLQAYFFQSL